MPIKTSPPATLEISQAKLAQLKSSFQIAEAAAVSDNRAAEAAKAEARRTRKLAKQAKKIAKASRKKAKALRREIKELARQLSVAAKKTTTRKRLAKRQSKANPPPPRLRSSDNPDLSGASAQPNNGATSTPTEPVTGETKPTTTEQS